MRRLCLILALLMSATAAAQDPARKKKPATKQQAAHAKPTPEQIRKFNQLQKKQQSEKR